MSDWVVVGFWWLLLIFTVTAGGSLVGAALYGWIANTLYRYKGKHLRGKRAKK